MTQSPTRYRWTRQRPLLARVFFVIYSNLFSRISLSLEETIS